MRPRVRARYVAVFHRIVVDVVEMADAVSFVADGVFPEAALPDTAGSLAQARGGTRLFAATGDKEGAREGGFDVGDPPGEIKVA